MAFTESDLRTAAHVCTFIGFVGVVLRVLWYCNSARPNETYRSFNARMEYGEFCSPELMARMEQDQAFRARMDALLRTIRFRRALIHMKSTRSALRAAIASAKQYGARIKALQTANNAREPNDDATGDGEGPDAAAEADKGLLQTAFGDASIKARVVEAAAKHQAAKAAVARMVMEVAQAPVRASRGGAVPVAAEASTRAPRRAGAAATVEPMDISTATSMEEGRSLL